MRRVQKTFAFSLLLSVCQACSSVPPPIVDKTGVDEGKYSHDLADCYHQMPAFAVGNPITDCMREKGYKILVAN